MSDTGERFFSRYLDWLTTEKPKVDSNDLCLCSLCCRTATETAFAATEMAIPPTEEEDDKCVSNVAHDQITKVTLPVTIAQQQQPQIQSLPFIPLWFNPYFVSPMSTFSGVCCSKYHSYCTHNDKRGRPPHDYWCSFKNNQK